VSNAPVDVRGPRFGAWITSVVLAVVLLTSSTALLTFQAVVFLIGALAGLRWAPYGLVFRSLVRPRLGPPTEFEAEAPPRFAQAVGAVFAVVGTFGFAFGLPALGLAATALALAAAFLNAAFGFCLGCEMYLMYRRATTRSTRNTPSAVRGAQLSDAATGASSVTRRGVEA
jgi:hypothetical protein